MTYLVIGIQRTDQGETVVGREHIEADGPDTALVNAWPLFPDANLLECYPEASCDGTTSA